MPVPTLDELRAVESERMLRVEEAQVALAVAVAERVALQAEEGPTATRALARAVELELASHNALKEALGDAGRFNELVLVLTPDEVLGALEPRVPLALLPVRLETRYRVQRGRTVLHIRVYPEPIHADAHEPELTAEELAAGNAFWAAAAGGADSERAAWATLTGSGGARRAAWIRHSTTPSTAAPGLKRAPWTRAATAAALPDRFMFLAYRGGARIAMEVGEPVLRPVAVGPDPSVQEGTGPAGLDEGTRWMVEFEEAERRGMAVRMFLRPGNARIDRLLAVGVAASLTPTQAATELDRLLGVHRFTDGLGLLGAGTPTNVSRTPAAPPVDDLLARERDTPPTAAPKGAATDAARLAGALGVSAEHLGRSAGAGATGEPDARAMLAALWPGTLGFYLGEMLSGSVNPEEAEALRTHAVAWVRPRGPLPTLRIGAQPYGVLPVTSLARFAPATGAHASAGRFIALLQRLDGIWATAARALPRAGVGSDPEASMAEILGQSPVAVDYRIRKVHYQGTLLQLAELAGLSEDERTGLATLHEALVNAGSRVAGKLSADDGLGLTVAADGTHRLALPRVQAGALSDAAPLTDDYLHFLRTAPVDDLIKAERNFGSPLLYLLARVGVLAQYVKAVAPLAEPPGIDDWLERHMIVEGLPGAEPRPLPLDLLVSERYGGPTGPRVLDVIRTVATDLATQMPILESSGFGMPRAVPPGGGQPPFGGGIVGTPVTGGGGSGQPPFGGGMAGPLPFRGGGAGQPPVGGVTAQPLAGEGAIWMEPTSGREVVREAGGGFIRLPDSTHGTAGLPATAMAGGDPRALGSAAFAASAATVKTPAGATAIADVLAGLTHLEHRPTAVLDCLLRETLDLGGHRLDPWITSLATERLDELRATGTPGVHLGAYGWVEDLAPGAPLTDVPAGEHPSIARPLFRRADSAGFVHAPSLQHAATAGVLRSAHLAHGGGPEMAIDLSSRRVRIGLWLLEGVRAGQPLGALLGYRLERALHDRGLDRLIAPLRDAAPLSRTRLAANGEPSEAVAANAVVDGLRLLELLHASDLEVDDLAPAADRAALRSQIDALADAADAVADLLLAESVHQLVGGNPARAAAASAAAAGDQAPAELDVTRTPRGGIATVHRVALVHDGTTNQAWPVASGQVRAVLDPVLEDIAARWLGPPGRVRIGVGYEGAAPETATFVTLDTLGLSALDFLYTAAPVSPDARGEVERRVADLAARAVPDGLRPEQVPAGTEVMLTLGEDLPALLEAAVALRRALGRARALEPADLQGTGGGDTASVATTDLDGRIAAALAVARTALGALEQALAGDDATLDLDVLRTALRQAAAIGLPGTWPQSATGDAPEIRAQLIAQARSVDDELAARIAHTATAISALAAPAGAFGTAADAQARRAAIAELVGEELPLLAIVAGDPAVAALKAWASPPAMGPSNPSRAGRASLVRSYLATAAGARRDLAALDEALGLGAAIDAPEPAILVGQHGTASSTESWVGLAQAPGQPAGGRTSLVALAPAGDPAGATQLTGLLVDEWIEVVPRTTEVTGLAVQANRPNAEAPHAILLAVPPDPAKAWDLDTLAAVLEETMDRAARRVVDLPALSALGHHLPALYVNSTDIQRLNAFPFDDFVRPVRR